MGFRSTKSGAGGVVSAEGLQGKGSPKRSAGFTYTHTLGAGTQCGSYETSQQILLEAGANS